MDDRIKDLMKDLEQYIQENWVAPGSKDGGWSQQDIQGPGKKEEPEGQDEKTSVKQAASTQSRA